MSTITIQPKEVIQTISKIKIDIPLIMLNDKCYVRVLCYDNAMTLIKTYDFELAKPDYNLWLKDEDLVTYVCEKYNFIIDSN